MTTYTLAYHFVARNLLAVDLLAAVTALPLDPKPVTKLGLVLVSDTPAIVPGHPTNIDRVIVYQGAADLAPYLENLNTIAWNKALSTLVACDPVVVT